MTRPKHYEFRGESAPLAELVERFGADGVTRRLAFERIRNLRWTVERAITTRPTRPSRKSRTYKGVTASLTVLAKRFGAKGVNGRNVSTRLHQLGWSIGRALTTPKYHHAERRRRTEDDYKEEAAAILRLLSDDESD